MSKVISFIRNKSVLYGVIAVVVIGGGWALFGRGGTVAPQTFTVHPGVFVQQVSVSGTVTASHDVDLGFSQAGRVSRVSVSVGDYVNEGAVLAEVENSDLKAAVAAEEAKLASIKDGTRPEQLAVTQAEVASNKAALASAIQSAYSSADSAVRTSVDQFVSNPRSSSPQLTFPTSDSKAKAAVENDRAAIEPVLAAWAATLPTVTPSSDLATPAASALSALASVSGLLADAQAAIVRGLPTGTITQTSLDTYAANISAARTSIANAITAINNGNAALLSTQKNLALEQAGATSNDIAAQQALVDQSKAALMKTLIVAPFSGTVTVVNAKVGAALGVSTGAISMIGSNLQIESYVPEVNVALIKVGNSASTTLDAYGPNVTFPARVASIDPAETVRDGVSTYRTILAFATPDQRIRSGMTANVIITTAQKNNIIAVPQGAITTATDGTHHVKVIEGDHTTDRTVTVGDVSSIGTIEITSGLKDGDTIAE